MPSFCLCCIDRLCLCLLSFCNCILLSVITVVSLSKWSWTLSMHQPAQWQPHAGTCCKTIEKIIISQHEHNICYLIRLLFTFSTLYTHMYFIQCIMTHMHPPPPPIYTYIPHPYTLTQTYSQHIHTSTHALTSQ